jgi:integrase
MAGKLNLLTVRQVQTLTRPGRHADGGGLYLKIRPGGSRQWVFLFARVEGGRRFQTEIGLGSAAPGGVTLQEARQKAEEARRVRSGGADPLAAKRASSATAESASITFGKFADDYVKSHRAGWSNAKHAAQWSMTLGPAYCKPLRQKPIAEIGIDDVLAVLTPVWQVKPETARRVRMRLEKVLDAAKVKGLRTGDNPARWKGHLDHLLPRHGKGTKSHHAAMPFTEVPAFMIALAGKSSAAGLALRFLILTATRTGETLNARWEEIDLTAKVWTIPALRMKSRRAHRVPLSDTALAVLAEARGKHPEWVFPGPSLLAPLSNMALLMQLRRMGRSDATTHGFRSSFRDWAAESTNFPREVCEMALAHVIESDTEAAYRRGDLYEKRRKLMEAWASYCVPKTGGKNIIPTQKP